MYKLTDDERAALSAEGQRLYDAVVASDEQADLVFADIGDDRAPTCAEMDRFLGHIIGHEAVAEVGQLRAMCVMNDLTPAEFLADPVASLAAVWADGVMAGIQFAQPASDEAGTEVAL